MKLPDKYRYIVVEGPIVVMVMGPIGPVRQRVAAVIGRQRDRLPHRGKAVAGQEHGNDEGDEPARHGRRV